MQDLIHEYLCRENYFPYNCSCVPRQASQRRESKLSRVWEKNVPSDGLLLTQSPHKKGKIKAYLHLQQETNANERLVSDRYKVMSVNLSAPEFPHNLYTKNNKNEQGYKG